MGIDILIKKNGETLKLPSKCTVPLQYGDSLIIKTPGGGGYGDPLERDPEQVLGDVLDELVSLEAAQSEYGVIIDPTKWQVLQDLTDDQRNNLRKID